MFLVPGNDTQRQHLNNHLTFEVLNTTLLKHHLYTTMLVMDTQTFTERTQVCDVFARTDAHCLSVKDCEVLRKAGVACGEVYPPLIATIEPKVNILAKKSYFFVQWNFRPKYLLLAQT